MSDCVCRWFPVLGWGQWVGVEFMPCNHGTHCRVRNCYRGADLCPTCRGNGYTKSPDLGTTEPKAKD